MTLPPRARSASHRPVARGATAILAAMLILLAAIVLGVSPTLHVDLPPSRPTSGTTRAAVLTPPAWFNVTSSFPAPTPPASDMASSAYDAADNVTVLFGGCQNALCPSNETWLFAGGRWVNATNPHDAPPARDQAGMDYDPNMHGVLLFGGLGSGGTLLADTWLYAGGRWTNLSWVGPAPPARRAASLAFDPEPEENGSVLFGGSLVSGLATNDTWVWEGWSGWVPLSPSVAPPPVEFANLVYDAQDHYLLLFGGVQPCGFLCFAIYNETWQLYAGEWWHVVPATSPPSRFGAAMSYDAPVGEVVLFGGFNDTLASVNDTWTYAAGAWRSVSAPVSPSPRSWSAISPDSGPGAPILFGGMGLSANGNDTWAFAVRPTINLQPSAGPWEVSAPARVNLTVVGGTPPYRGFVDFGDGSQAHAAGSGPVLSTSHVYDAAGTYTLSASLTDGDGVNAAASAPAVTVTAGPAVAIRAPAGVDAGHPVRLTATLLVAGTPPVAYAWDLGDGTSASGANVTHTYASPGTYLAAVNATDGAGAVAHASVTVRVASPPSLSAHVSPGSANVSAGVHLFANVTGGTAPFAYAWRFGDGNASGAQDPVHAYAKPGTYTVDVWVNDSGGGSVHGTLTVTVAGGTVAPQGAPGWFWPALIALLVLGGAGVAVLLFLPRRPRSPASPP